MCIKSTEPLYFGSLPETDVVIKFPTSSKIFVFNCACFRAFSRFIEEREVESVCVCLFVFIVWINSLHVTLFPYVNGISKRK